MNTDLHKSLAGWFTAGTLAPDSLDDREAIESARADLLIQFSNSVALIGFSFVLIFWAGLGEPLPALVALGGVAAAFATRLVLRLTGSVASGAHWTSLAMYVTFVGILPITGGLSSPGLSWLLLIPVFALIFGGLLHGILWSLLVAAGLIALYLCPAITTLTPNPFQPGELRLLQVLATFGSVTANITFFMLYNRFVRSLEDLGAEYAAEASRDPLTNLPNRRAFDRRLAQLLHRTYREPTGVVVGVLDLDGFKQVNDRHGHPAGDALLQQAATRLEDVLRGGDLAARVGGDEFALLLEGVDRRDSLEAVAERVADALEPPYEFEGATIEVGGSLGFAWLQDPAAEEDSVDRLAERLYKRADGAMYDVKGSDRRWKIGE